MYFGGSRLKSEERRTHAHRVRSEPMSNRNEHRAARSRKLTLVDIGRLQPRDPNYGLQLGCYVCATSHAASGCARIQDGPSETYVPLCDACYADDDTNRIVRTFLKHPILGSATAARYRPNRSRHWPTSGTRLSTRAGVTIYRCWPSGLFGRQQPRRVLPRARFLPAVGLGASHQHQRILSAPKFGFRDLSGTEPNPPECRNWLR